MNQLLCNAKWIWCNANPKADEYGEFVDKFFFNGGKAVLKISADSNYAAYLNGELVAFGQYADFPHDKVYDEIDITAHCQSGENRLAIIVWYYGIDTSLVYYLGKAALMYTVAVDGDVCCQSDETTLSRMSRAYQNHRCKLITNQVGFSYTYDANKEDAWLTADCEGFAPSVVVEQTLPLRVRPCKRLELRAPVVGKECKRFRDGGVIYDLGGEEVGFLQMEFTAPYEQTVIISYGEHLEDGCVRRLIDGRDFSVVYRAKAGKNVFLNPFRRLGAAYLEVHSELPIDDMQIALRPTMYPLEEKPRPKGLTSFQNKLYDMCVRTLVLCAHEHYEDCPWREQGLYAMDSRNQMLCGYYAFSEYEFARASLQLMSKDNREDGLLSCCYPMSMDFLIPSFSLHYFTSCHEYMKYSGDEDFIEEIFPKLQSILRAFTDRIGDDGLVPGFVDTECKAAAYTGGSRYFNFYEWREGLDGCGPEAKDGLPDLLLNTLLSKALQHMAAMAEQLGKDGSEYVSLSDAINEAVRREYLGDDHLFYDFGSHQTKSELGNALAVLCGAAKEEDLAAIEQFLLTDCDKTPVTLSMRCFKYDALLKLNAANAAFVLKDIERTYTPIVEYGGTTVWEDEGGCQSFDAAGSMCHGWSALPIYYYHTLLNQ